MENEFDTPGLHTVSLLITLKVLGLENVREVIEFVTFIQCNLNQPPPFLYLLSLQIMSKKNPIKISLTLILQKKEIQI